VGGEVFFVVLSDRVRGTKLDFKILIAIDDPPDIQLKRSTSHFSFIKTSLLLGYQKLLCPISDV
jgi:hypothetical protein